MTEQVIFNYLLVAWFLLAGTVFILLFFISAPYGRHLRKGWGLNINPKTGWVVMEAPAVLVFAACFIFGSAPYSFAVLAFFFMWQAHYVHRAFVYPLEIGRSSRRMPLLIVGFGFTFSVINAYLNGRYLFTFSGGYASDWLGDPRFVVGVILFGLGYIINRRSDGILLNMRKNGISGYSIPEGGLYRWVSCPNYLGEVIIWTGWAVATWSLPGLAFALWTIANLVPRARAHHAWYRKNMPDYPPERKALLPRLW